MILVSLDLPVHGLPVHGLPPAVAAVGSSTSTPSPTPVKAPNPDSVTPGLAGFLVVFVLALVTWLLMRNMTGRLRRMRFREEERIAHEGGPPAGLDGEPTRTPPRDRG